MTSLHRVVSAEDLYTRLLQFSLQHSHVARLQVLRCAARIPCESQVNPILNVECTLDPLRFSYLRQALNSKSNEFVLQANVSTLSRYLILLTLNCTLRVQLLYPIQLNQLDLRAIYFTNEASKIKEK